MSKKTFDPFVAIPVGFVLMVCIIFMCLAGQRDRYTGVDVKTPRERAILDASNSTGVDIDTVRHVYER